MIIRGDCVEAMRDMPEASVDAVVCDPPYGLEFMGKEWDSFKTGRSAAYSSGGSLHDPDERRGKGGAGPNYTQRPAKRCGTCGKQSWSGSPCQCDEPRWEMDNSPLHAAQAWHHAWATEALRVLKPGGHLLAFGGTRTYHRLACAIEDAGFEIRDCLVWMYGSGFPKSLNLNGEHAGWGTALKPAHEPIVLARKPLTGTVASNVTRHGTGALNVDGCRVEAARGDYEHPGNNNRSGPRLKYNDYAENGRQVEPHDLGRWPSNVLLDETAAELLDEQSGETVSRVGQPRQGANGDGWGMTATGAEYGDSGGASRFFYTAKASRAERNAGLEGFAERELTSYCGPESRVGQVRSDGAVQNAARTVKQNHHPTVKPIDLMRWLVRLVTPPGGHVLDPFTGSGTTGIACALEGFTFTGIEREAEYADIAEARIAYWTEHGEKALLAMYEAERRRVVSESGQMALM